MSDSLFRGIQADYALLANAATDPNHATRLQDVQAMMGLLSGVAHAPVSVTDTNSIALVLVAQALSASVRRKTASFVPGEGAVGVTADGLVVELGNTVYTAAAGDHGHDNATALADGFMSAADKAKLALIAAQATRTPLAGNGVATTASRSDHTHGAVSDSAAGFMTPDMLESLENVAGSELSQTGKNTVGAMFDSTNSIEVTLVNEGSGVAAIELDVRRKTTSLGLTQGIIDETAAGLVVRLGANAYTAAPGNHTHDDATQSASGFMSSTDKARLDALAAQNQWLPPVAGFSALPLNTDPVGSIRLCLDDGRIYRVIANVGFATDQWKPVYVPWEAVAPASSGASGVKNSVAFDSSNFFVCIATNHWKKTALSDF